MNIRIFNQKYLEPASIAFSVLGIVFLCQPQRPNPDAAVRRA